MSGFKFRWRERKDAPPLSYIQTPAIVLASAMDHCCSSVVPLLLIHRLLSAAIILCMPSVFECKDEIVYYLFCAKIKYLYVLSASSNICSVAQRKRVGLITQRSEDRNLVEQSFDIVAEWSKALHLGCSLHWRRFKSCRCQLFINFYPFCNYVCTLQDMSLWSILGCSLHWRRGSNPADANFHQYLPLMQKCT